MVLLPVTTLLGEQGGTRTVYERERETERGGETARKREASRGEEWRGRKAVERERERDGNRDRDVPAGKQMVAPFIGLFVGSAITSRPAIRPAGVPLYIPHVEEDRLNCPGLIYSTLTATRWCIDRQENTAALSKNIVKTREVQKKISRIYGI